MSSFQDSFSQTLGTIFQEHLFTDMTLKVGTTEIQCHKVILAASSPYFYAMFTSGMKESNSNCVELVDVDSGIMEAIIKALYTRNLHVSDENLVDLLRVGDQFQFSYVMSVCKRFLMSPFHQVFSFNKKYEEPQNAIFTYMLAKQYNLSGRETVLKHLQKTLMLALSKGANAFSTEELILLDEESVIELINDDWVPSDGNEDMFYKFVTMWIDADPENREACLPRIAQHIRLPFCTPEFLSEVVEKDPRMAPAECQELIAEARMFQAQKDRQHEIVNPRTRPRSSFPHQALIIIGNRHKLNQVKKQQLWIKTSKGLFEIGISTVSNQHGDLVIDSQFNVYGSQVIITGGRDPIFPEKSTDVCGISIQTDRHESYYDRYITSAASVMQHARYDHATVILKDQLYIFGGISSNDETLKAVEKKKICPDVNGAACRLEESVELADMPVAVSMAMAAEVRPYIYIMGGKRANKNNTSIVQQYDTVHDKWTMKSRMPRPCVDAAAVRFNDSIYVVGGMDRLCMMYAPTTDTWTVLASPLWQHSLAPATVYHGKIVVCGGLHEKIEDGRVIGGVAHQEIEEYDPLTGKWQRWSFKTRLPAFLPCKLFRHALLNAGYGVKDQPKFNNLFKDWRMLNHEIELLKYY